MKLVRLTMSAAAYEMLARIVATHRHTVSERAVVDGILDSMAAREVLEVGQGKDDDEDLGPMHPLESFREVVGDGDEDDTMGGHEHEDEE